MDRDEDLLDSTRNSAQHCVQARAARELGGEWIQAYVWLIPLLSPEIVTAAIPQYKTRSCFFFFFKQCNMARRETHESQPRYLSHALEWRAGKGRNSPGVFTKSLRTFCLQGITLQILL